MKKMKLGVWQGETLLGSGMYIYRGGMPRATPIRAPLLQIVAPRVALGNTRFEPLPHPAMILPGELSGPTEVCPSVTLFVMDPACHLARLLMANPQPLLMIVTVDELDKAAVRALALKSIEPMLTLLAQRMGLTQSLAQLAQRVSEHPRLAKLFRAIDQQQCPQTTTQAAVRSDLSVRRFCEVFKRDVGMPYTDYLAGQRFFAVLAGLAQFAPHRGGALSASALAAGFFDLPHMSRMLKRYIDAIPSDLHGMGVILDKGFVPTVVN